MKSEIILEYGIGHRSSEGQAQETFDLKASYWD